jgi:hypothetical protein
MLPHLWAKTTEILVDICRWDMGSLTEWGVTTESGNVSEPAGQLARQADPRPAMLHPAEIHFTDG